MATRSRGDTLKGTKRAELGSPALAGTAALGLAIIAALSLVACSGGGGGSAPPTPSGPSGSLGVVTLGDARVAVAGLCQIAAAGGDDRDAANATFYDRVHEELHVIVAAVEGPDRAAATVMQQDKFVVEDDLLHDPLPRSFVRDVDRLASSTRTALGAVGIEVPTCAG